MAGHYWVGAESAYNDPTIIYHMIISSYFSDLAMELGRLAQDLSLLDPENNPKFRLSFGLGGWTYPPRRWLAKFHGDEKAVAQIDLEHKVWLKVSRAFIGFTVGALLINEPENIEEGFAALWSATTHCGEINTMRTCADAPRLPFNFIGFAINMVDYALRVGNKEIARAFLNLKYVPVFNYKDWDIGQPVIDHYETHFEEIFELYQNNSPEDDPAGITLKDHKWGPGTITCALCHRRESRTWPTERIRTIVLPDESVSIVEDWPEVETSWHGSIQFH